MKASSGTSPTLYAWSYTCQMCYFKSVCTWPCLAAIKQGWPEEMIRFVSVWEDLNLLTGEEAYWGKTRFTGRYQRSKVNEQVCTFILAATGPHLFLKTYVISGYLHLLYFSTGHHTAVIFTCQFAKVRLKLLQVGVITILNNTNEFSIRKITTKILLVNVFCITRHSGERYVFITMETWGSS